MAIGDLYNLTEAQTRDSGKPGAKICTHEKKKKTVGNMVSNTGSLGIIRLLIKETQLPRT